MKRTLITGGTGFVGASLVRRLLRDGHEVHLLVRTGHQAWRLGGIEANVCLHPVSLEDQEGVERAVAAIRPAWIFHLAVHGAYSWQTDVRRMVHTNLLGTINLVEACLQTGFEAFVNTGSSSEYGWKDHAAAEHEWIEPNSYYAITKASATHYCRHIAQTRGVRLPTLRLYSAYGPYEEPKRLVPTLIARGLQGELPPLVNPDTARDYVFVEDVCDAYLRAATTNQVEAGAVYNVGTGAQTPLREIVAIVRRLLKVSAEPEWGSMSGRIWDTSVWVADNRKIRRELGWEPHTSLEAGLTRTIDWFRAHPELLPLYEEGHCSGTTPSNSPLGKGEGVSP